MKIVGMGLPEVIVVLFVLIAQVLPFVLLAIIAVAAVKYLRSKPQRERERATNRSLGEVLAEERQRCGMTQEFVAQSLGVSRQAVPKWEKGASDPSTHNLLALAKLYGVDAADLLHSVAA